MRRNGWLLIALVVFIGLLSSACANQEESSTPTSEGLTAQAEATPTVPLPSATPITDPEFLLARVESLEVISNDDKPAEISVRVRGVLSNSCSEVDDVLTELKGSVYTIAVLEVQSPPAAGQACVAEEMPFEQTVNLEDVAPGSYTVMAHGLQGTFSVAADQNPTPASTPTSSTPMTGSVSGIVWHDLCEGTADAEAQPPQGCSNNDEDGLQGDGLFADEPGIVGVRVGIGTGDCNSPATEFTLTDDNGNYVFSDLPLGEYCVSIEETGPQNENVLLTGIWTSPPDGVAQQPVTLDDAVGQQGVDFGWDFAFLPIGEFDPETCTDSFAYVEDVNIPDDTEFAPNQALTKRWVLQNNGTCPWTEEYSIVFVGGDLMSADEVIPLTQPVAPGQSLEVGIDMTAPTEPGTYRGNWQVANAEGDPFGIDGIIEDAFWLRIVVAEGVTPSATSTSDSGTIGGVVWDDLCNNTNPGAGCIEFPEDSGIYVGDGSFGPLERALAGITISLATSACPTDGTLPSDDNVIATAITSEDGLYQFPGLDTGMYCIFMDALAEENVDLLIPGNWTWPATGVGRYTFFLDPGEQALDLDFGWDYVE